MVFSNNLAKLDSLVDSFKREIYSKRLAVISLENPVSNGDFADEIAVYRPSNGNWYVKGSLPVSWGFSGDIPVPGDYDGNGSCDIAVYRPSNGRWYVQGQGSTSWGLSGDIPVPGDYDGCGDTEIAVLRPSNGKWYIKGMGNFSWYLSGDYPLPVRDTNADGDPYQ